MARHNAGPRNSIQLRRAKLEVREMNAYARLATVRQEGTVFRIGADDGKRLFYLDIRGGWTHDRRYARRWRTAVDAQAVLDELQRRWR